MKENINAILDKEFEILSQEERKVLTARIPPSSVGGGMN